MIETRPGVPPSHASESEHRRQLANVVNLLNQTTPFDLTESVQFFVGASGDFTSINNALKALSARRPRYAPNGAAVTLVLGSGFEMAEQVLAYGIDLSWITITSEDAEVMAARDAMTTQLQGTSEGRWPLFGAVAAKLPIIDVLFNMDDSGTGTEREAFRGHDCSQIIIRPGKGCKNASARGLYLTDGSKAIARQAIFDNAGDRGVWARFDSSVVFIGGSATNCGWTAFQMHSSYGDCENATLTGAGHYGLRARRGGYINAEGANFSNANELGVNCNEGSTINLRNATGTDCGEHGIQVTEGSRVEARAVNVSGSGWAGVLATSGSVVDFRQGDASNSGGNGFSPIHVQRGSIINAHEATGTLSQTANTLTAAGIIFQQ